MSGDEKPNNTPNTRNKDKTKTNGDSPAVVPITDDKVEKTGNDVVDEVESTSRTPSPSPQGPFGSSTKKEVYEAFQKWALKTYGDSAKTKTVTKKKSARIMKILKGEEHSSSENSKFRFWVKAKGFRIGPPPKDIKEGSDMENDTELYVPCTKIGAGGMDCKDVINYKKVAVVENFFDIIYDVHVEMDGRGGKHAGQKRTYKAIAETYAFLPREAVTRFLMSCSDCQKRMHLGLDMNSGAATPSSSPDDDVDATSTIHGVVGGNTNSDAGSSASPQDLHDITVSPDIDYSLPITTTYLKHMRSLGYSEEDALNPERAGDESESSADCKVINAGKLHKDNNGVDNQSNDEDEEPMDMTSTPDEAPINRRQIIIRGLHGKSSAGAAGHSLLSSNTKSIQITRLQSPGADDGIEDLSIGIKEDDEDEDDDECEKFDSQKYDPERLKAFNMFVRLFVDENLDRMVPISKQPKEKIQAIIDSCQRQFPEFAGRSRKRIRTYLKSCRRNKRSRDQMGFEAGRPTPPHLTSAIAEQILAVACENESNNAKRMRLGLQPISTASVHMADLETNKTKVVLAPAPSTTPVALLNAKPVFQITTKLPTEPQRIVVGTPLNTTAKTTNATPILLSSLVNGGKATVPTANSMITYQAAPGTQLHAPATLTASIAQQQASSLLNQSTAGAFSAMVVNGAADLRVKKSTQAKCSLNVSEVTAVRQLISGYRESAAFLMRSAEELEQLLLQQN